MHRPPSTQPVEGSAAGIRVGVVVSRYHRDVTDALLAGARDAFLRRGGREADFIVADAPGAFELPLIAQVLADDHTIDAVVALGCVITGETRHDEYINASVAHALQQIALATAKPVGFGLLTVATIDQARARAGLGHARVTAGSAADVGAGPTDATSGAHGNKGAETLSAVVEAVRTIERLCQEVALPQELEP